MAGISWQNSPVRTWFTLVFSLLQLIPTYLNTAEAHGHAFVQTDYKELKHMVDGSSFQNDLQNLRVVDDSLTECTENPELCHRNMGIYGHNLDMRLEPSILDFGEQPIGMPNIEMVTVYNLNQEHSLTMVSIAGNTPHFHSSFFQHKVIEPGGNTTFDIVFLPRVVGNAENNLYIHTDRGMIPYPVFGVGVANPYRLRPFLGARVPLNSSFSALVNMHNPHRKPIQITEMFTSGGDLHLELPSGKTDAPQKFWEIPPYQTKSVMRASFLGRVESNHTAFIRIRTNYSATEPGSDDFLILPFEVEVSSAPGLYSSQEMLDFGTLRSLDEPKTLPIYLTNIGQKDIHITSISLMRLNEAVRISYEPVALQPYEQHVLVANITYHPLEATSSQHWSGKVIIKAKERNNRLIIPYQVHLLKGSLAYNGSNTMFFLRKPPYQPQVRELSLTNLFNFTLVILDVLLLDEAKNIFKVEKLPGATEIAAQKTDTSIQLTLDTEQPVSLSTTLQLVTNASLFQIPLHVYTGRLKYTYRSHRVDIMDFGIVGTGEKRSILLTAINDNPVEIPIPEFSSNMANTIVEFMGMEKGSGPHLTYVHNTSEYDTDPLVLPPYHYTVFNVALTAPAHEGTFVAQVFLITPHQRISIDLTVRTTDGYLKITPSSILFPSTFPGRKICQNLTLQSTFRPFMSLTNVTSVNSDPRFYYIPSSKFKNNPSVDPGGKKNLIGKICFDGLKGCLGNCYVGLAQSDSDAWLSSLTLSQSTGELDSRLYTSLRDRWRQLELSGHHLANNTLRLDTNLVTGYMVEAEARLVWPSILAKSSPSKLAFPLTLIGGFTTTTFTIQNPLHRPLLVQVVQLAHYPDPIKALEVLQDTKLFDPDLVDVEAPAVFSLVDSYGQDDPSHPLYQHVMHVTNRLGVTPSTSAVTLLLKPRSSQTITVAFAPIYNLPRTALILLRNNLTVLETLVLDGQGGKGEFHIAKIGPERTLKFDIKHVELAEYCTRKRQQVSQSYPMFQKRVSFTASNSGQLPIRVMSMDINGYQCRGYGFQILNCVPFTIKPNSTYTLEIMFMPDFTQLEVRRQLRLVTDQVDGDPEYMLVAKVPQHMLPLCSDAVPRPAWEWLLHVTVAALMLLLLVGMVTMAWWDAYKMGRLLTQARVRVYTADNLPDEIRAAIGLDEVDKAKRFDLKAVSSKVRNGDGKNRSSGLLTNFTALGSKQQQRNGSSTAGSSNPGGLGGGSGGSGRKPDKKLSSTSNSKTKNNNLYPGKNGEPPDRRAESAESKTKEPSNFLPDPNAAADKANSLGRRPSQPDVVTGGNSSTSPKPGNSSEFEVPADGGGGAAAAAGMMDFMDYQQVDSTDSSSSGRAKKAARSKHKSKANGSLQEKTAKYTEKDETSSTTTESSSTDSADLADRTSVNQQFVEFIDNLAKNGSMKKSNNTTDNIHEKNKPKSKPKSKKNKKKENFQPDIYQPSSLQQLPYPSSLETDQRRVKNEESVANLFPSLSGDRAKRITDLNKKPPDTDSRSESSSEWDKDSPPIWDDAQPIDNPDQAFAQFAMQTLQAEKFLEHGHLADDQPDPAQGAPAPKSPTPRPLNINGPPGFAGTPASPMILNPDSSSFSSALNMASSSEGSSRKKSGHPHSGHQTTKNSNGTARAKPDRSEVKPARPSFSGPPLGAIGSGGVQQLPPFSSDSAYAGLQQPDRSSPIPLTPGHNVYQFETNRIPDGSNHGNGFLWNPDLQDNWLANGLSLANNSSPGSVWTSTASSTFNSNPQSSNSAIPWSTETGSPPTSTSSDLYPSSNGVGGGGQPLLWASEQRPEAALATAAPTSNSGGSLLSSLWPTTGAANDSIWSAGGGSSDNSFLDMSSGVHSSPGTFDPFDAFRSSIWGSPSQAATSTASPPLPPAAAQAPVGTMWTHQSSQEKEDN